MTRRELRTAESAWIEECKYRKMRHAPKRPVSMKRRWWQFF